MKIYEAPEVYSKVVSETEDGTQQVRLTVNEFRGVEYLHLRKYYLDFEGDYKPSKDGVAMSLDFQNSKLLFEGLVEILSLTYLITLKSGIQECRPNLSIFHRDSRFCSGLEIVENMHRKLWGRSGHAHKRAKIEPWRNFSVSYLRT